MGYDRLDAHDDTGGTHIGMFLHWAALRDLVARELDPLKKTSSTLPMTH